MFFKEILEKIIERKHLSEEEAYNLMTKVMEGEFTQNQISAIIASLRCKGETADEITGFAKAMRDKCERIYPNVNDFIDTCGTGGDGSNTFNISTAAAIIASSCGVAVAKHGNRSVSSKCGSADVLEALGVDITLEPFQVKECIEKTGIGFMFAPLFHKSMRNAAQPRKELGIRTIFNFLGPLTNPANAPFQLLGIFSPCYLDLFAEVLAKLGIKRAMIVSGDCGMDEIATTGITFVAEVCEGRINRYQIHPSDFGIKVADIRMIKGGDASYNAEVIRGVFEGKRGPYFDIAVLNAAAALYICGKCKDIREGILICTDSIDKGYALEKLNLFASYTQKASQRNEEVLICNHLK